MSKNIYHKVIEELQEEFIVNSTGMNPYSKNILSSLIKNKAEEYKLHKIQPTEEELRENIKNFFEVIVDTIIKSREYKDKLYKKSYDKLKALVDEGTDFQTIFTEVYDDESYLNDIFIRLIEDKNKVVITSAKQLQELSGITEIYGEWDNETEKIKPYPGKEAISTKKEAQEEALRQMEHTLIQGMYNRYFTTLEDMLEAGAKYKDILLLSPKDFNLPDQWSGTLAKNKEEVILYAISFTYLIDEPGSLMMLPSLRAVAEEIEAPYSVLMDCYKLFNNNYKIYNYNEQKKEIGNRIDNKLSLLIGEIGDKYYTYFDKEEEYKKLKGKALKDFKEDVLEELKIEFSYTLSLLVLNQLKENDKKDLDELRTIISQDIAKYFLQELIDFKNLVSI